MEKELLKELAVEDFAVQEIPAKPHLPKDRLYLANPETEFRSRERERERERERPEIELLETYWPNERREWKFSEGSEFKNLLKMQKYGWICRRKCRHSARLLYNVLAP